MQQQKIRAFFCSFENLSCHQILALKIKELKKYLVIISF